VWGGGVDMNFLKAKKENSTSKEDKKIQHIVLEDFFETITQNKFTVLTSASS
jgi:hypothetical protein